MTPVAVPGCSGIYRLDAEMFGTDGVNSPYVVDGTETALVDTGPASSAPVVADALLSHGIEPGELTYLVPTHAHLDHAGGVGHLAEQFPDATVLCHETAVSYLTDERKLERLRRSVERAIGMAEPYGRPTTVDRNRCRTIGDGDLIDLGERTLDVIDAPGHAPHQVCLFDRDDEVLFSADANGMHLDPAGHRPTTPPPDFDLEAAIETVQVLREFDPHTVLYAHFGWGTPGEGTAELRGYERMLPAFVEEIQAARTSHGSDPGAIAREIDERWQHWALQTDIAGVLQYLGE